METVGLEPSRPPVPQKAPWLVFFSHGKRQKSHTFFSISEGRCYVRNILEFRRKYCVVSCHGWLFMEDRETQDCLLINPVSMGKIHLPELPASSEFSYERSDCILSAPPTDPNCVILYIDWYKPIIMYWHRLHHKWNQMQYKMDEDGGISTLVACNGKVYGITHDNEILVVIEFNPDPEVRLMEEVVPPNVPFVRTAYSQDMVESCGEIFRVYLIYVGHADVVHTLEVFRMDFSKMKWVGVDSIGGDRAFFLRSGNCSLSCSAVESGVKGDCIYYVLEEDPILYRFDMTDRSITTDLPCPNISTPWDKPHWVLPSS